MSTVWNRRQHPIVIAHPHSPTVPEYLGMYLPRCSTAACGVYRGGTLPSLTMTPINFLLAVLVPVYISPNKLTVMREYVP